jgi:flavin reductase (DIM6/NTAB) family NADH-FMN oxidoreductase RutF
VTSHGNDGKGDRSNDSTVDPSDALVRATDYPLYVVTVRAEDELSGCLAGFVTQSSIHPVRFLVCVSKINHTFGIVQRSAGIGLHLLGSDQTDVASLFGEQTGDEMNKFDHVAWTSGVTGVPILAACSAWVEGRVLSHTSGGDHEAFLIDVVAGGDGTHPGRFMLSDGAGFSAGHPE